MKITKKTTIGQVLEKYPEKGKILVKNFRAMCLGCPMSQTETLEEAALHHDVEINKLLVSLNKK